MKPAVASDFVKNSKGPRQSRWDKSSDPAAINKGDTNLSKGHKPPVMNFMWQVWLLIVLRKYLLVYLLKYFFIILFLMWSINEGYNRAYISDNLFYHVFLTLDGKRIAVDGKVILVFTGVWFFWLLQPEDSNSKVAGNGVDLLVEDTTDIISLILRKEIEGKVNISKPKTLSPVVEEKESLGETFVDAKEDLLSGISLVSLQKEINPNLGKIQNNMLEIDRKTSNRKRKTVDTDGKMSNTKLAC